MNEQTLKIVTAFCESLNQVKKTGLRPEDMTEESFLGGDLGIDSIEMLEIWYELEQRLGVTIDDAEKRDIYTVGEVAAVIAPKLGDA